GSGRIMRQKAPGIYSAVSRVRKAASGGDPLYGGACADPGRGEESTPLVSDRIRAGNAAWYASAAVEAFRIFL
ncbi:MAG: hypothetical protein V8Q27_04010, partial [Eubacteriales bacterium]